MEDTFALGLALLIAGVVVVAVVIGHETLWKPHRRRRIERDHARSKRNRPIG